MLAITDLMAYIFEGKINSLSLWLERRVKESRRFRAFVDHYRGKIRSKHRLIREAAGLLDLRLELATAFILLQDDRIALKYEEYQREEKWGPDFTASFRVNLRFNVEVKHLRNITTAVLSEQEQLALVNKLLYVILEKSAQMPPSIINLVLIGGEGALPPPILDAAGTVLKLFIERKEDSFFVQRGFKNTPEFLRQFQRISGIVLYHAPLYVWRNPLAKHPLPPDLTNTLIKLSPNNYD